MCNGTPEELCDEIDSLYQEVKDIKKEIAAIKSVIEMTAREIADIRREI